MSGFGFNWIDLAVVAIVGFGMYRGRMRGMSEELLDVIKWIAIIVVGGLTYRPIGQFLASYTHMSPGPSYVFAYLSVLIVIRFLFNWVKRASGEKLVGSDVFGSLEYYLGFVAGGLRFACYIVVFLAILNARNITSEQLASNARMQQDNFGDISFPTIGSIQQTVFVGSASGQLAKRYLSGQLIYTSAADQRAAGDTLGKQRERAISEILGEKR